MHAFTWWSIQQVSPPVWDAMMGIPLLTGQELTAVTQQGISLQGDRHTRAGGLLSENSGAAKFVFCGFKSSNQWPCCGVCVWGGRGVEGATCHSTISKHQHCVLKAYEQLQATP